METFRTGAKSEYIHYFGVRRGVPIEDAAGHNRKLVKVHFILGQMVPWLGSEEIGRHFLDHMAAEHGVDCYLVDFERIRINVMAQAE